MLGALFMEYYSYSMNSASSAGKKQKTKTQIWGLKRRSKHTLNKLAFQPASQKKKKKKVLANCEFLPWELRPQGLPLLS